MEMTHPALKSPFHGRAVFEWLEGRQFLIWRWEAEPNTVPTQISIIGGGDKPGVWPMHYFDSRGISRVYTVSFEAGVWKMWRDHPGFWQRATGTFEDDGRTIRWLTELREREEDDWKPDLEVIYRRAKP
jgi:hypothetical protein